MLPPLATTADLTARGIDVSDPARVDAALAAASAAIREAASATISLHTGTITIPGRESQWLRVPGWAVSAVTGVAIDGDTVTDYRLVSGSLWRSCGWSGCVPSIVDLTVTQGVDPVPADIVDLCAALAAASILSAAEGGYDPRRGVAYERIDDYQYGLTQGDDEVISPVSLPARTRLWLARRFGVASHVTEGV